MRSDRLMQNGMMPRQQSRQRIRILLRQIRAAFDIGEQEGDRAGG